MSSTIFKAFAILLSAVAGVALGIILHLRQPWLLLTHKTSAPVSASSAPPSASAMASAAASASGPSTVGSGAPPTSDSARAGAAPESDPAACMRTLFTDDTFESPEPELAKLCDDKSPSKFGKRLKELLIAASHGRMTGGMKEWGILGIYEIAAMSALRGHCCPNPAPLEVAGPPGTCPPLSKSLAEISKASHGTGAAADLDEAVAGFDKDVRCIVRSEQTQAFGDYGPLGGGEGTALDKTIRRIRPAP